MPIRSFVQKIHDRGLVVSKSFHDNQKDLIQIIQQMDECKGFRDFGCPSLWVYCQKFLKLDDYQASTFITLARKSREVPELKTAIDTGSVALSKARRIAPILTQDNKSYWIQLAQTLPKQQLEREIAKHAPQQGTKQQAKYVAKERVQFQCGLSQEDFQEFLTAQNLVSQKSRKHADYEQTFKELIRFYNEANNPVRKAERAEVRKRAMIASKEGAPALVDTSLLRSKEELCPGTVNQKSPSPRRRSYSAELEHQINLRDQRQCTSKDEEGNRCRERRWLEFHHIIPLEKGGPDTLDNMRTLCSAHHQMQHQKAGVSDRMRPYIVDRAV